MNDINKLIYKEEIHSQTLKNKYGYQSGKCGDG